MKKVTAFPRENKVGAEALYIVLLSYMPGASTRKKWKGGGIVCTESVRGGNTSTPRYRD